ncbi:MAG: hypothetical protein R2697_01910 [Ilumatobacteraceae bacterium]
MSWIERIVEERLAKAAEDGELAASHLEGKPIADLHWERPAGWWAKQFAERELSHDRRAAALEAAAASRAGFWRCADVAAVRAAVAEANAAIDRANVNIVPDQRVDRFDVADIVERWHGLQR